MTNHGHFHWNELATKDIDKAKAFYADTLGWTFTRFPSDQGPEYWVAMDGEDAIGGMFSMAGPGFDGMPEAWISYIAVDDIDARVEKAKAAGATIMRGPMTMGTVGRLAMLQEPGGAMVGWITPAE